MSSIYRGDVPPPFGQQELKQREKAKRRRADALKRTSSLTTSTMTVGGVGSTVGYGASMLGSDGFGFVDGIVCGGLGIGSFLAFLTCGGWVQKFYRKGLALIGKRLFLRTLPVWVLGAFSQWVHLRPG